MSDFHVINDLSTTAQAFASHILILTKNEYMWKEHFKNLLGKSPKVTDKPITKIIYNKRDIKLGKFTQEKLDVVLTNIKNRKAAGLEIPSEVWKTRKFDDLLLRNCNAIYN